MLRSTIATALIIAVAQAQVGNGGGAMPPEMMQPMQAQGMAGGMMTTQFPGPAGTM